MKNSKKEVGAQFWAIFEQRAQEGKKRLEAKGLREKDIPALVERRRKLQKVRP